MWNWKIPGSEKEKTRVTDWHAYRPVHKIQLKRKSEKLSTENDCNKCYFQMFYVLVNVAQCSTVEMLRFLYRRLISCGKRTVHRMFVLQSPQFMVLFSLEIAQFIQQNRFL